MSETLLATLILTPCFLSLFSTLACLSNNNLLPSEKMQYDAMHDGSCYGLYATFCMLAFAAVTIIITPVIGPLYAIYSLGKYAYNSYMDNFDNNNINGEDHHNMDPPPLGQNEPEGWFPEGWFPEGWF